MFCNRGVYHEGWTAVTRHCIPWVVDRLPPSPTTSGSCTAPHDWTQAHDLAAEHAGEARRAEAAVPGRGPQVQRASPRRPPFERFNSRPRRAADARSWNVPAAVRPDGAPVRELDRHIKNKSHSITAEIDIARRGRERCDPLAGRRVTRAGASTLKDGQADVLLQPLRARAASTSAATIRCPWGRIRCGWSSATTAGARQGRHVSPLPRRRANAAKVVSKAPSRWSSPQTRRATSARHGLARERRLRVGRQHVRGHRGAGCSSTSPRQQRTLDHLSRPRSASTSRWQGNRQSHEPASPTRHLSAELPGPPPAPG